jgi:hypothetical protein
VSLYDPLFAGRDRDDDDLDQARRLFAGASRPFLRTPWSWYAWAVVLPAGALSTEAVGARWGLVGLLVSWTAVIVAGGAAEGAAILGGRSRVGATSGLAAWVLRAQGNLSLVAVLLSLVLIVRREAWALPGLWLLLLGHGLLSYGGLALPAMRWAGMIYQVGGLLALLPGSPSLWCLAVATAVGNLWIGRAVARNQARESAAESPGPATT